MLRSRFLWKLYTGYAVLILLTTVMLGVMITRSVERDLVDQIQSTLQSEAALLHDIALPYVSAEPDSAFQQRIWLLGARTSTRLTVIRADGIVVADSKENPALMDNHRMRPEVLEALAKGIGVSTRYSRTLDRRMMYVAVPVMGSGSPLGFVRASVPLTYVDEQIADVRDIVVIGGLTAAVLALLVGFLVARTFTRPLLRMTAVANAIARGDYEQQIHVERSDEVGQLADSLNEMTTKLRDQINTTSAERAKMVAILAGMVEGVIAVDREERIVHINAAAERILELSSDNVMGRRIWEATRVREISDSIADAMREQHVSIGEARISSLQSEQVIQTIAAPLRDTDGELDGAIVVLHDVSDLRQLEKVRRDFIANISHELKTPLAAIRGLVETLIDDKQMDGDTHFRFLEKISVQSNRLSNLVVDLLTISRLESDDTGPEFEKLDLRGPVTESYRTLVPVAEKARLVVEARVPDVAVPVRGDVEALREMVDNLLNNAIKYTPKQGRIDLRLWVEGSSAILEIEDTGIGIASEDQGRVFERFYRVDKARSRQMGGTGLGLSIVKHVSLSHGGNVSVRSAVGEGSTFRVQIPLDNVTAMAPEQAGGSSK